MFWVRLHLLLGTALIRNLSLPPHNFSYMRNGFSIHSTNQQIKLHNFWNWKERKYFYVCLGSIRKKNKVKYHIFFVFNITNKKLVFKSRWKWWKLKSNFNALLMTWLQNSIEEKKNNIVPFMTFEIIFIFC